jgi:hypothetical protein
MGLTLSRRSFHIFSTFGLCCPFACLCIMPLSGIVNVSISLLICSSHDAFLLFWISSWCIPFQLRLSKGGLQILTLLTITFFLYILICHDKFWFLIISELFISASLGRTGWINGDANCQTCAADYRIVFPPDGPLSTIDRKDTLPCWCSFDLSVDIYTLRTSAILWSCPLWSWARDELTVCSDRNDGNMNKCTSRAP